MKTVWAFGGVEERGHGAVGRLGRRCISVRVRMRSVTSGSHDVCELDLQRTSTRGLPARIILEVGKRLKSSGVRIATGAPLIFEKSINWLGDLYGISTFICVLGNTWEQLVLKQVHRLALCYQTSMCINFESDYQV